MKTRAAGIDGPRLSRHRRRASRHPRSMSVLARIFAAASLVTLAQAAPPAALVAALENLRDQKSYSWEVINSDPGPVEQKIETRRGTVTTVQQNTSPNLKGQIDRHGDILIRREWVDGLRLDTIITANGGMVTNTPEGWLSDREILTAQAEERLRGQPDSALRLAAPADRPTSVDRSRLVPFLARPFEFNGDSYTLKLRSRAGDPARPTTMTRSRART